MDSQQPGPAYITLIGASAGGLNAVIELCAQFKPSMNMAALIVLHISKFSMVEIIIGKLQRKTSFTCKPAEDGEPLKRNHIYIAVDNKHLLVKDGKILLGEGPAESMWRPSIDVLFRSGAAEFDSRSIGIILTGLLQDGLAGMQAIQRCNGVTIVQDPEEADYPDMPMSVLNNMDVNYCVKLPAMGAILEEKTSDGVQPKGEIPADVQKEAAIAQKVAIGIEGIDELGDRSVFSCPDCGGGLWEIQNGELLRYRCHIGHAYTAKDLMMRQEEQLEGTLWIALRMMEERKQLLIKMAIDEETKGWIRSAENKRKRGGELTVHIDRLKQLLFDEK